MADYISLPDLAEKLDMDRTSVRRAVQKLHKQLGITIVRRRTATSNGQLVNCLTTDDANKFYHYHEKRKEGPSAKTVEASATHSYGYFYIIQLVPEALPDRVKIGYTDNLKTRLAEHQTSAPTAQIVAHWKCKRSWDQAVMDCITREGCALVMNEVFEGDIESMRERAEKFFAMMPDIKEEVPLSPHSPLKKER
jgi:hypothetical protein